MPGIQPTVYEMDMRSWRFKFPLTTMIMLADDRANGSRLIASLLVRQEVDSQVSLCRRGYRLDGEFLQRRCQEYLIGRA